MRHLNLSAVKVSYYAPCKVFFRVRQCCVGGAAKTHLDRIERIQHKFLLWLDYHSATASRSLNYNDLLQQVNVTSLSSRRHQHDLLFLRNLFRGRVDSPALLGRFSLSAPQRLGRRLQLFHVPFGRVSSVMGGLFTRLPRSMNNFVHKCPESDIFHDTLHSFKTAVISHVRSIGIGEGRAG